MSVYSLAELCRQEEALCVGSWVMFSPSDLGQHHRDGVSRGECIGKGSIHAEKIAVFPNVLYILRLSTPSTSCEPEYFLFIDILVGKHCKTIMFCCQVAKDATVSTKLKPIWKPPIYHLSCSSGKSS